MNKHLIAILSLFLFGFANAATLSDEEATKKAVIKTGPGLILSKIDKGGFWLNSSGEVVEPGRHVVTVENDTGYRFYVICETRGGYIYEAKESTCYDLGPSKEAARQFEKEDKVREEERAKRDAINYQKLKEALQTQLPLSTLQLWDLSFERKSGIFKEDPDNLLAKLNLQLQPYREEEKKRQQAEEAERARIQTLRDQETAAAEKKRQQEEDLRRQNELKQLAKFRKNLSDGDETSCGLVIEKKPKVVKIQPKNGAEQWIKLEDVYPAGGRCDAGGSSTQASTAIGQLVCTNISTTGKFGGNTYDENIRVQAFVESASGSKYQVRISGMVSEGSRYRSRGTNVDRINGDVVYTNGAVLWDQASNWRSCN